MSLNHAYVGYPTDINIGNGKTSSAVGAALTLWSELPERTIFSNIKLMGVPYEEFRPDNIYEVLETRDAIVIFDEIHAIVHKNDHVSPGCTNHGFKGLCYHLQEFFRQVRKRDIDTFTTSQTFDDIYFQVRQVMNVRIYCELEHLEGKHWKKCLPMNYLKHKCPDWHYHRVKQLVRPSNTPWAYEYFYPEPFYNNYDSFEIVKGWIPDEEDVEDTIRQPCKEPIKKSTLNMKGW